METTIVRGHFIGLLGQRQLSKSESENLFVAGILSLLDRILGISMKEVLTNIKLSDDVGYILLMRSVPYLPYVLLTEVYELNSRLFGPFSSSLKISPTEVSAAHLSALAWAQNQDM